MSQRVDIYTSISTYIIYIGASSRLIVLHLRIVFLVSQRIYFSFTFIDIDPYHNEIGVIDTQFDVDQRYFDMRSNHVMKRFNSYLESSS